MPFYCDFIELAIKDVGLFSFIDLKCKIELEPENALAFLGLKETGVVLPVEFPPSLMKALAMPGQNPFFNMRITDFKTTEELVTISLFQDITDRLT